MMTWLQLDYIIYFTLTPVLPVLQPRGSIGCQEAPQGEFSSVHASPMGGEQPFERYRDLGTRAYPNVNCSRIKPRKGFSEPKRPC